jgi:hypothetical protein
MSSRRRECHRTASSDTSPAGLKHRPITLLLVCGLAMLPSGCVRRTAHAAQPVVTAPAPKPIPAPTQTESLPPATPPPVTNVSPPSDVNLPGAGNSTASLPPKPPLPAHKPTNDNAPATRPPAPQISPQLSPSDQAAFEQKTNENIAAAEKNLGQTSGRLLNAAQNDLVEKIRGFLNQAHEAISQSDWTRAQNLSQKAYLLSVELINSLSRAS